MQLNELLSLMTAVADGRAIIRDEALMLADSPQTDIEDLMYCADKLRKRFFGNRIKFCSIINAKAGACSEDCTFCAQSAHYPAVSDTCPLVEKKMLVETGKKAKKMGAFGFSIVTSGRGIEHEEEIKRIGDAVSEIRGGNMYMCVSLGAIKSSDVLFLKKKGLKRFHHNLETAESYFGNICSTHSYSDKIRTIQTVKEASLEVCSGGIFGMGESWEQRIEMAFALRELDVDSIPINFLNPIKGTPLEYTPLLKPYEALRIISLYRFIFPKKDITVCGGREKILRDLQSCIFYAGANGTMVGNYLTTKGRPPEEDFQMARDLGLVWK